MFVVVGFVILGILMSCSTGHAAQPFTATQYVRNYDGSLGNATSANSYGKGQFFRYSTSDPVQSTTTIEYALPSDPFPARSRREIGSGWVTDPAVGERVVGIVEVPGGLRVPYPHDLSYVGASSAVFSAGQTIALPTVTIQAIPTPEEKSGETTDDTITIKWTGITTQDASGQINSAETYAVYRSTQEAGTYTFRGTAVHVSGEVQYTDPVDQGFTYYYKLRMRYSWPGNTGTPYYETTAESRASAGISPATPGPSVENITPNTSINNGTRTFIISGQYFTGANSVYIRRTNFANKTASTFEVTAPESILATFEFSPTVQAIGTWDVVVNVSTLGVGANLLTLTAEAPVVASVEPVTAGTNGTITGFKLYGQRLYGGTGTSIVLTKEGQSNITATGVATGPGYSTMTCNIALSNATIGPWSVTYTNMFGQRATSFEGFSVTAEAPTITSVVPTRAATGATPRIYVNGTNLFTGALFEMRRSRAVITAKSSPAVTVEADHTRMWGTFAITPETATGVWDIYVKNSDNQSTLEAGLFTIVAAPAVSSIVPATRENNASADVVISGANFFGPISRVELRLDGHRVTAESVVLTGTTQINCTLPITGATIGTWDVVVINNDGSGTLSNGFTVTSEAPVYLSVDPATATAGIPRSIEITGNKFYENAIVQLRRTGRPTVTATGVSVPSFETITCNILVPNLGENVGLWDIYIENTDGKSTFEAGELTVSYGTVEAPSNCTITALTPTSINVTWTRNGENEEMFRIQMSTDGTSYTNVGTAAAASTTYTGNGTTGLSVNTRYWARVRAEGGGQESEFSTAEPKYTLAAAPSAEAFGDSTSTVVTANWSAGLNPAGTLYYCQNQTNSNNSGNISALTWADAGLLPDTAYTYRVRGVNGDGIGGEWTSLGTSTTKAKRSLYFFAVDNVKLLSGDIIGSTSNISAVFSSESGIDMTSFRMEINGVVVTGGTGESIYYDSYTVDGIMTTVNYKIKSPLAESTYTIKAYATDPSGVLYEDERTNLQVMAEGTKTVVGYVLPHPNPFDPVTGPVKLTYRLATDTNVTIYVFDVNGRLAWKESYLSGFNGGKAGYNEVLWNGYDAFSRILDNDVYLIRIVESGTGRVMGKGKIVVVKSVSNRGEDDSSVKAAAAPVYEDGNGPFSNGLNGMAGLGKAILLGLVGLIAFEEVVRMYFTVKKVSRLKR